MEKTKRQTMRFSDSELDILKGIFAENDDLLKSMRKQLLQLPMTAVDLASLEILKGKPELSKILRKMFLPELDGDVPIGQQIDLWMTIQVNDKSAELAYDHIVSRELLINIIEEGLSRLEGTKGAKHVKLSDLVTIKGKTSAEIYADLIARNTYIAHVEQQLTQIFFLSGFKDETTEATKERLSKDSSK